MDNKELEIRSVMDFKADGNTLTGYAIVFNSVADLGSFKETIRPGAITEALRNMPDVPLLMGHDWGKYISRTGAKTLTLQQDERGLHIQSNIPNTTLGNDVRELIKTGDIAGMSFGFTVPKGGDKWSQRDGIPFREITAMQIHEVSLTPFPAYRTTSVAVRSLEQWQKEQVTYRLNLLKKKQELSGW